jgi:hypothetical protein
MLMEDNMDTTERVDFDGDVDMDMNININQENDEWDADADYDDEEEEETEEEDEDEEEDKDQDDSKEPWTIAQREMVNTLADDVDTMVDHQPIQIPEQGHEMCYHNPGPQPLVPALQPQ